MKQLFVIRGVGLGPALLALCLLLISTAASAESDPPGQAETEGGRVVRAHRGVDSAVVQVRFAQYFSYPDETKFVSAEYRVVLDRPNKRLRVDRPGYTLVCDGVDVLLVAEALPGRHLRMPLGGELTYERLVEIFPDLGEPAPPALVMLLAQSPVEQLGGGQGGGLSRFTPRHPVQGKPLHLRLSMPMGAGSLTLNRETMLLDQLLVQVDPQQLVGSGIDAVRLHYAVRWSSVNEPVDEPAFKLDLKQSHEMTTLAAFLSPNGGNAQPGPSGQGGGVAAGASLVGMPLPEIELDVLGQDEKVKLSELNGGVVVLECFATWSKASVLDLPALAEFKDWCKEEKHGVQVYAVAVGEQPEQMAKWMAALEKTAKRKVDFPVLMDTSTEAAMALKLPTVPRTLIVVDGRVVDVYGGVKPTYLDDLKERVPGWLEKVKSDGVDNE